MQLCVESFLIDKVATAGKDSSDALWMVGLIACKHIL